MRALTRANGLLQKEYRDKFYFRRSKHMCKKQYKARNSPRISIQKYFDSRHIKRSIIRIIIMNINRFRHVFCLNKKTKLDIYFYPSSEILFPHNVTVIRSFTIIRNKIMRFHFGSVQNLSIQNRFKLLMVQFMLFLNGA